MVKVVKFGGSSLASAEQFTKVGDIIRSDESRKYVVPSAPGKRNSKRKLEYRSKARICRENFWNPGGSEIFFTGCYFAFNKIHATNFILQ